MKIHIIFGKTLSIAGLVLAGCAGANRSGTTSDGRKNYSGMASTGVSEAGGREVNSHHFVEVGFRPGSSELSVKDKNAIAQAIRSSDQPNAKIDEVIVLAWADEEMPSRQKKS